MEKTLERKLPEGERRWVVREHSQSSYSDSTRLAEPGCRFYPQPNPNPTHHPRPASRHPTLRGDPYPPLTPQPTLHTLLFPPLPTIHVGTTTDPSARLVTRLLRAAKYEVRGYASASEFLDSDPCAEPGCILLDLQMPGVSGLDLQESLARMEERLPVIF